MFIALFASAVGAGAVIYFNRPQPPAIPARAPDSPAPSPDVKPKTELRTVLGRPGNAFNVYPDCEEVMSRNCADRKDSIVEMGKCLESVKDQADRYCKKRIAMVNAIVLPCAGDIVKLCADAGTGGGHMHRCLFEEAEHLSSACRAAVVPSAAKN
jgi:hypothetical protein